MALVVDLVVGEHLLVAARAEGGAL